MILIKSTITIFTICFVYYSTILIKNNGSEQDDISDVLSNTKLYSKNCTVLSYFWSTEKIESNRFLRFFTVHPTRPYISTDSSRSSREN